MTSLFMITIAETIGCMLLGWLLAVAAVRWADKRGSDKKRFVNGDALAFVGGALGILLGLLLVFASQHFSDARTASREEATAAVTIYDTLDAFPAEQQSAMRRDLFCTMDSLRSDDWRAATVNDVTGSENTNAWLLKLRTGTDGLDQSSDAASSAHYFVNDALISLGQARQMRLLLSNREIPEMIWLVIGIGIVVFSFLLALHMGPRRPRFYVIFTATGLILCTITVALTSLDYPFQGNFGNLRPIAMNAAISSLQDRHPTDDFSACPQLKEPVYENWQ